MLYEGVVDTYYYTNANYLFCRNYLSWIRLLAVKVVYTGISIVNMVLGTMKASY